MFGYNNSLIFLKHLCKQSDLDTHQSGKLQHLQPKLQVLKKTKKIFPDDIKEGNKYNLHFFT